MKNVQRILPWVGRLVLLLSTVIFTLISTRFISDPLAASAATGISFSSPIGITNGRIGFGAFPLAFAVIAFFCLISPRRLFIGLSMVATVMALALAVRLFGAFVDHTMAESMRLLVVETLILVAALAGLFGEWSIQPPQQASHGTNLEESTRPGNIRRRA